MYIRLTSRYSRSIIIAILSSDRGFVGFIMLNQIECCRKLSYICILLFSNTFSEMFHMLLIEILVQININRAKEKKSCLPHSHGYMLTYLSMFLQLSEPSGIVEGTNGNTLSSAIVHLFFCKCLHTLILMNLRGAYCTRGRTHIYWPCVYWYIYTLTYASMYIIQSNRHRQARVCV